MSCFEWPLDKLGTLTQKADDSRLHVMGMGAISFTIMQNILKSYKGRYKRVIAFKVRARYARRSVWL